MKKIISFVLLILLLAAVMLSCTSCGRIKNGSYVKSSPFGNSYEVKGNKIHVCNHSGNFEYVYSYMIDRDDIITFELEKTIEHPLEGSGEVGSEPWKWELTELNGSKFTKTKFGFCIGNSSFVRID